MTFGLDAVVSRQLPPEPWAEGEKIPWDDPAFSERMLREHLSQAHDAASRRNETIDAQVAWVEEQLLEPGNPARILDLGCGPGLYATRLAVRGHDVRGIDFSPASIRHARESAADAGLAIDYELGDLRRTDFGGDFDLAILLYGELNVFTPADAHDIVERAHAALRPGGRLLIELHRFESLEASRDEPSSWYATESGLFSGQPHLVLSESFWDEGRSVAMHRWYIVDAESGAVEQHADAAQAYTDAEYVALLDGAGFAEVGERPEWPVAQGQEGVLTAYVGQAE